MKFLVTIPKYSEQALSEKCPYLKIFWSIFSRIWTEYGEIIRNTGQKNSKYGHFLRSKEVDYSDVLALMF